MGILGNIQKIVSYMNYTKKERNLQQEVIRASMEDNNFYEEYSSFVEGLQAKLDYLLETEPYKSVQFTPNTSSDAKYFMAAMDDVIFTTNYKIDKTVAGDFQFSLRTLTETDFAKSTSNEGKI